MNSDRTFNHKLISFLETYSSWIIALNIVAIVYVTLLPFDFTIPYNFSLSYVLNRFRQTTSLNDLILNVFFFIPLGLGLGAFWHKKNKLKLFIIFRVFLLSFFLSLSVEVCQLFLVSRNSSYTDLLTNSLGGTLGCIFFLLLPKFNQSIFSYFSFLKKFRDPFIRLKSLTIFWLFYFFLMAGLLINIQDSTKLSNWDNRFPLMIGNEATGDRSWNGEISYLCISKNSFNKQQIKKFLKTNNSCTKLAINAENYDDFIAAYSFLDSQKFYPEITQNLPQLENKASNALPINNAGIIVNKKNWLKTKIPASKLTQQLQNSSQFTILTKVATANFQQEGPARIISLSQNQMVRNLTIAQWRKDLTLRIRMPLTGTNGKKPEIRIKNFFSDRNFHQLAISYDGLILRTYIDQVENAYQLYLGSEAALFWSIFAIIAEKMYLNVAYDPFYHLLYYGLIFAPLGISLSLISSLLKISLKGWIVIITGGLIIPPLLIETIITTNSIRFWNLHYSILGFAVITISFLLTKYFSNLQTFSLRK